MNSNSKNLLDSIKKYALFLVLIILFTPVFHAAVVQCNSCGSCTAALATNSVVELNTSLDVASTTSCINITKSNVVFKCVNGVKIKGNGAGVGIFVYGVNNATVEDCHIENFTKGILAQKSNVSLIANTVENNGVGVQGESSEVAMNASYVCWNGVDMNSSDWGSSTGTDNSCDEPPGTWRDAPFLNATLFTPQCTYICSRVDTIPPTVTITSPASGTTVTHQPIKVNITASDNSGQPVVCYALVGGLLASPPVAVDSGSTGTLTVTRYLPIGTPSLQVVCADKAGNKGYSSPITLNVASDTTCTCDSQLTCSFAMMSGGCVKVFLTKDLTVAGSFVNVTHMALNVTFDCQGHTITGDGKGVAFHYADDHLQRLQNCKIVNFSRGLLINYFRTPCVYTTTTWTNVNVTNVTIQDSVYNGVLVSCDKHPKLITWNVTVNGTSKGAGIVEWGYPDTSIYLHNTKVMNAAGKGVSVAGGVDYIYDSLIINNKGSGVYASNGFVSIKNTKVLNNGGQGLWYWNNWGYSGIVHAGIRIYNSIFSGNHKNGIIVNSTRTKVNKTTGVVYWVPVPLANINDGIVISGVTTSNNGLNGLRFNYVENARIILNNIVANNNGFSGFNFTSTKFTGLLYLWHSEQDRLNASLNGFAGMYLWNTTTIVPFTHCSFLQNKYGVYMVKSPVLMNTSASCSNTVQDIYTDEVSSLPFLENHLTTRLDDVCNVPYDLSTGNFFFDYGYFGCTKTCSNTAPPTVNLVYPTSGTTVNYYPIQFKVLVSGSSSVYRCGIVLEGFPVATDFTVTPGVQTTIPYLDRYNFLTAYVPSTVKVMCQDDNGNRGISAPVSFTPVPGTCECYDAKTCSAAVSSNLCKKIIVKNNIDVHSSFVNNSASVINKTFDCQHHLIWGNGTGVAFYIGKGSHNFTLENCAFKNFTNGMVIGDYSHDIYIINTSFTYNRRVALNISMSGLAGAHSYSIHGKNLNLSVNGQYGLFITGGFGGWDTFDNITVAKNAWTGIRIEYWNEKVKITNSVFKYDGVIKINSTGVHFAPFYPYVVPPTQPGAMDNVGFGLLAQTPMMDQDLAKQSYSASGYTIYLDHDNASLNLYGISMLLPGNHVTHIYNVVTSHNLNRGYDLYRYFGQGYTPQPMYVINSTSIKDGYVAGEIPPSFVGWDREGFVFTCTRPPDVMKNLRASGSVVGLMINTCEGGIIPTYVNIQNSRFCGNGQDILNGITSAFISTRQYGTNNTCTIFSKKSGSYFDDYVMFGCAHTCLPTVSAPTINLIYPKPSSTIDEYPMTFNFTVSGTATQYNCGVLLNNYTAVSDYSTPVNTPTGLLYIDQYNLLNISSTAWNYYKVICYDGNNRGFSTLAKFHAVPGICRCWTPAMCNAAMGSRACTKVILTKDLVTPTDSFLTPHGEFKNKVFDCQGHTITRSAKDHRDNGAGITIGAGETNSVIENCILRNYTKGIAVMAGASNFTFRNITILNVQNKTNKSKGQYGIILTDASISNITFDNIKIINSTDVGIYSNGMDNHYNHIVVKGVATNALIMNDSGTDFENAVLESPKTIAYILGSSVSNTLDNVSLQGSQEYGLYIDGASQFTGNNLNIEHNLLGGVYIGQGSLYTTIADSYIAYNGEVGEFSPLTAGIYTYTGTNYTTLSDNTIIQNYGYGVESFGRISSMVSNHLCFNSYHDVYAKNTTVVVGDNNYCSNTVNYRDKSATTTPCVYSCGVTHTCQCNSCVSCTAKLNDPACGRVILIRDITTTNTSCLDPLIFASNKVLDCKGHSISAKISVANFIKLSNLSLDNCVFNNGMLVFMSDDFNFENDRFHSMIAAITPNLHIYNSHFVGVCLPTKYTKGLVLGRYSSPGIDIENVTLQDYSVPVAVGEDYYKYAVSGAYGIGTAPITHATFKNVWIKHTCGSSLYPHKLINLISVKDSLFENITLTNGSYGFTGVLSNDKYITYWNDDNTINDLRVINVTQPIVLGGFINSKFNNIFVKNAKVGLFFYPCNSYYCVKAGNVIKNLYIKNASIGIDVYANRPLISIAPTRSLIQNAKLVNITDTGVRVAGRVYLNLTNVKVQHAHIGANFTRYANIFMNKSVFCFNSEEDVIADHTVISPTQVLSTGVGDYCDNYINWNDVATVGCTYPCSYIKAGSPIVNIYRPAPGSTVNSSLLNVTFDVVGKNLPRDSAGAVYPITVTIYLNDTPINPLSYRIVKGVKEIVGSQFAIYNGTNISVYVPGTSYTKGKYKLTIVATTKLAVSNLTSETFFWNKTVTVGTCFCKSCAECAKDLEDPSCTKVVLQNDLAALTGTCVKVTGVENKTFNLAGWRIDDTKSGSGIWLLNSQNVTIENGTVSNFKVCINKTASYNIYTTSLKLINCTPVVTSVPIWFVTPPTPIDGANLKQKYIPIKVGLAPNTLKNNVVNFSIYLLNSTGGTIALHKCAVPSPIPPILYCGGDYPPDQNFNNLPEGVYQFYAKACNKTKCVITKTRTIKLLSGGLPYGCLLTLVLVNRDQQHSYKVISFTFDNTTFSNPLPPEKRYIPPGSNQTVVFGSKQFCQFLDKIGFINLKMLIYNPLNRQTNVEQGELAILPSK